MLNVIHDNDFTKDSDGWVAYCWLQAAQSRGLCKILAVISSWSDHTFGGNSIATIMDYARTYYRNGLTPCGMPFGVNEYIAAPFDANVFPVTTWTLPTGAAEQDSDDVYGNALLQAADASVTILTTGRLSALSRFMQSVKTFGGKTPIQLITAKVSQFVCGSGVFPPDTDTGDPSSTNLHHDGTAAAYVLSHWPATVPILYIGEATNTGTINMAHHVRPAGDPMSFYPMSDPVEAHDILRAMITVKGYTGLHTLSPSGYAVFAQDAGDGNKWKTYWHGDVAEARAEGTNKQYFLSRALVSGSGSAVQANGSLNEILEQIWGSYILKDYPIIPATDQGCRVGYDWNGTRGAQASSVADATGHGYTLTGGGTTKPIYLGDGILQFEQGGYLETVFDGGDSSAWPARFGIYYGVMDVYIKDATNTTQRVFASRTTSNGTNVWEVGIINSTGMKWYMQVQAANVTLTSTTAVTNGWHRIAWSRELTNHTTWTLCLYIDGVKDATTALNPSEVGGSGTDRLRINGRGVSGTFPADLPIGMFRFYHRRNINSQELMQRWMQERPKVRIVDVKRGVDRGDGTSGSYAPAYSY
ncbi:MAG: hypothetical protein ABFD94_15080 [Armatimonadia bacterium]